MLQVEYKRKQRQLSFFITDEAIGSGAYRSSFNNAFNYYGLDRYKVYECIGGLIIHLPPEALELFTELKEIPILKVDGAKKDYSIRDIFKLYAKELNHGEKEN